jgi:hypothetical protein
MFFYDTFKKRVIKVLEKTLFDKNHWVKQLLIAVDLLNVEFQSSGH